MIFIIYFGSCYYLELMKKLIEIKIYDDNFLNAKGLKESLDSFKDVIYDKDIISIFEEQKEKLVFNEEEDKRTLKLISQSILLKY